MQQPQEGGASPLAQLGRFSGHGLTLGLSTAFFAWLGNLADERLHTGPLFVILGTFLGFGAGFYSMYRQLVIEPRRSAREQAGDGEGGNGTRG